jgi:hypothetical protein
LSTWRFKSCTTGGSSSKSTLICFSRRATLWTQATQFCRFALASLAVPDNGALQKHSEGHRHHGGKEKWREWEGVWVPWHVSEGYRYSAASGKEYGYHGMWVKGTGTVVRDRRDIVTMVRQGRGVITMARGKEIT